MQVEAVGAWAPRHRRRALRHLRRTLRRARRTAFSYRNNQPHARREAGLAAALAGRHRQARRLLDRSLEVARAQQARHEEALTLVARGRAGGPAGWPDAADDLAAGEALLAELAPAVIADGDGAPASLSLADRFERLLDEGRRIAGALTPEAVHDATRIAATALLRPQVVRILDLDGRWDDPGASSNDRPFVIRSLVEEAVAAGRPRATGQDSGADAGESMLLSTSRSALAAPIFLRGRAVACLYVTHDEVGGLYGDDDERIAQFLTAIAGAALETAEFTSTRERLVADRTAELAIANDELRTALAREQEVAERLRTLDQLKNEFVAMVAHDLRSPMASISGAANTILTSGELLREEDRRTLLEMISRSTIGLSGLVEDVLQVARIESGQFSYEIAPFDLAALVERTAAEVEVGADGPSRITVGAPAGLPLALGDEARVWQVLTNLLSNALKFSPEGAPVMATVSSDGVELTVSIVDEGAGIAPEDMPRLFQKFSRIRAADVRGRIKGTGLGLYICQRIVEAQDGRIWAESRPGEGSTFAFTLPIGRPAAAP